MPELSYTPLFDTSSRSLPSAMTQTSKIITTAAQPPAAIAVDIPFTAAINPLTAVIITSAVSLAALMDVFATVFVVLIVTLVVLCAFLIVFMLLLGAFLTLVLMLFEPVVILSVAY